MANQEANGSVAAVDLGSNSFHMVIGRLDGEELSIVDRLRDPVRMAAGFDRRGVLGVETVDRVLASLGRFNQRLADIAPERVRAIGTSTFREARGPRNLLERASEALGFPIEVLSGHEEARLIYLGVGQDQARIDGNRLVIDIGGGSTECILGKGSRTIYLDSLDMGCVSFSQRFFPEGKFTRKAFRKAETAAQLELETLEARFRRQGWSDCVGSSGTINAVAEILRESEPGGVELTFGELDRLRTRIIDAGHVGDLSLPGLQADRVAVLAGGVAILCAVFESLGIQQMRPTKAALREGVLYDLLGRIRHEDARDRTVRVLSERYSIDQDQAQRVERIALACLDQVAEAWSLGGEESRHLLAWAAQLHEIGLAIAYSGHHKHGAYILANSNMPGFSRDEQDRLSALVHEHRRKFNESLFTTLRSGWGKRTRRLCILLRVAVRLSRSRSDALVPEFELRVVEDGLELRVAQDWLEAHPLTRADLEDEDLILASSSGLRLNLTAR